MFKSIINLSYVFILVYPLSLSHIIAQEYSLGFDGQNDYVRIPDHEDFDFTENYTLEAWIFPETFSWLAGIISKYQTNAANGYMLRLTSQSPYTGVGFDELVSSNGVFVANQWYHIAAVNSEGTRTLYINGSEIALSGSALDVSINNNAIRIASDYGGRYFDGRIDEVRVWNIVREEEQIISSMNTVLSGQEEGLVAYYSFNEGSGDTLFDRTSNGHDGVVYGDPVWLDGFNLLGGLGDINFDEVLNIYDAVMLVAIMLTIEEGTDLQLEACDTNQDGIIDIEDIVLLFEWILGLNNIQYRNLDSGTYSISENKLNFYSEGDVAGFQFTLSSPIALGDVQLPNGWNWNQSGKNCFAFSTNGTSLPANFTILLNKSVGIESIKLVGWGEKVIEPRKVPTPSTYNLEVYPNPFNPVCTIAYEILEEKNIKILCYEINGTLSQTIDKGIKQAGRHYIDWQPKGLSSGVYLISISTPTETQLLKVLYLK